MRRATLAFASIVIFAACSANASPQFQTERLVDRITWGKTAASLKDAEQIGPEQWLRDQLHPRQLGQLPTAAQAQIDAMRISREPMTKLAVDMDAMIKAANQIEDSTQRQAAQQAHQKAMAELKQQTAARSLLRALYSPNQLQEQMSWFWFNHFNVQADKRDIRAMIGDYEDQAIRPHALGKFKDLLKAAELHPAMLRYLDNDQNAAGRVNENFAREILELHTMGVGSGYSQKDVEEMARVLTGVGVSLSATPPKLKPEQQPLYVRRGLMEFNPARHDFRDKTLLGQAVSGTGLPEFENTLDMLAKQPATARHVSTKMALYFMGSAPPKLVAHMASTFQRSDGDIADTLAVLFKSPEFKGSLGKKLKDPVHYTVSAVRLAYDDRVVLNTMPLQGWISRLGQSLYGRDTPDGYPLEDTAWSGPGQLTALFEVARQIGLGSAGLFKPDTPGSEDHPAFPQLQNALYYSTTQQTLSMPTKATLAQARSPSEWNALYLSSPEFLHR